MAEDGVELFDPPPATRTFAPGDLLRFVIGLALVAVGALVARLAQGSVAGVEQDVAQLVARLPDRLEEVLLSAAQFVVGLVPTAVLVVLLYRRRWRAAGLLLLSSILASLAMLAADVFLSKRELAEALETADTSGSALLDPSFPSSSVVASMVAMAIVASPWLSRRWKRTVWWAVGAVAVMRLIGPLYPAFDLVLALGAGTVVGSGILLVFGSPTNRPGPIELLASLRAGGWDPRRIDAPVDRDGAFSYGFADRDGTEYEVVLRTPDERDAELLARLYRGLRFRASEVGTAFSTVQRRLEHEALMMTLAARGGVRAASVARMGGTDDGAAFFVATRADLRPAVAEEIAEPAFLTALWEQLRSLHGAGIAHRSVNLESIAIDGDAQPWLVGFDRAQAAPEPRELARDMAELLVETAVVVGPATAVSQAVAVVGGPALATSMLMLQPLALPPATRARAKSEGSLLDDLREEVTVQTGEPALELEELERIKPRTLLIVGASALALYSLLPQFTNLSATVDAFGEARPLWLVGALIASMLTYAAAALAFQGAVAEPIPFAPNVRAQVAASFAGLVGPAGAGGFALNVRFLERFGVKAADAGAAVGVNALVGGIVHISLMIGFFIWTGSDGIGGFSFPSSTVILLIAAVVLALVGVLSAVRTVRRKVLVPLWSGLVDAVSHVGRVFRNPNRVLALFGGSALLSLAYVAALACCVEAYGGGLTLPQLAAAYLGAVALATFAPTPGGLGAFEAALIAALTGFGLVDGVAVSVTLTFRLATFWLPLLPGWLAMNQMQRNGEL